MMVAGEMRRRPSPLAHRPKLGRRVRRTVDRIAVERGFICEPYDMKCGLLVATITTRGFEQQRLVGIGRHGALPTEQTAWLDVQRRCHNITPHLAGG